MRIEVKLMHQNSSSLLNLSHVRRFMKLAVEVPAYCIYYFMCLSFQFLVYFMVSEIRVVRLRAQIMHWALTEN